MRTKRINVRVTEAEKQTLQKAAQDTGISEAVIVRDAVRRKVAELQAGAATLGGRSEAHAK